LAKIELATERLTLVTSELRMAKELRDFYVANSEHLQEWEDAKPASFFTVSYQREIIKAEKKRAGDGSGIDLWIRLRETGKVIGKISVFGIIGGNFSLCVVGYKLDKSHVGFGYMAEALGRVERYLFLDLNFHRIEINIIPRNTRSLNVAKGLGYTFECEIKDYIFINGFWQNHYRFAKINENWREIP
jgi:ribosomal-protein-alanine N-acetyltransferase